MIISTQNNVITLDSIKRLLSLVLVFICISVNGQIKNIGLPFVHNYSREDYKAGTQNWSITQDNYGFMYFANNLGVLRFDGANWDLYPLPNNSVVRSVKFIDGKLYTAGYEEFGFFDYDIQGKFVYTSISKRHNIATGEIDEVWRIHSTNYGIVFQSYRKVFVLTDDNLHQIAPKSAFGFSFFIDQNLYVIDREFGLYVLQGKSLSPIILNNTFFKDNEVNFIFSNEKNGYLIGTANNGVFVYDGELILPWTGAVNQHLKESQIFTGIELGNEVLAIGSIQNGVFVITKDGQLVQHLNRYKGLQNNTVLSLFYDNSENLWLGLDNGIDFTEMSGPITVLNYCFNIETVYTSIVYNSTLYVGTNQGLFARDIREINTASFFNSGFNLVENTKGQVWNLKVIDGKLFCGHNYGTFLIDGLKATRISDIQGGWDYVEVPGNENIVIGGNFNGLELFEKSSNDNKPWKSLGEIDGIDLSCREIEFDELGALWVTHGYEGMLRVTLSDDLKRVKNTVIYNNTHGLPPMPYSLSVIGGKLLIVTQSGLYSYNAHTNRFSLDEKLNSLLPGHNNFTRLVEDDNGDIWFFASGDFGVYRLQEDGQYIKITIPFKRIEGQFLMAGFEQVYVFDRENVFIAGQNGLIHYNSIKSKTFQANYPCYIHNIKIKSENVDSTIVSLHLKNKGGDKSIKNVFQNKYNSLSFHFFAPFYEALDRNMYKYRLVGFDNRWSEWGGRKAKDYTNLREGVYRFEVKAKNIYEQESDTTSFIFTIKPPFYRSIIAFVIYLFILIIVAVLIVIYFKLRLEKARMVEQVRHEEKLEASESKFIEEAKVKEEKIEKLKTDKLKNEMRYKNMELANATMHLIQKNKFLTKLKGDLMVMFGDAKVDSVKSEIKQIVKKIDKDFKNEQQFKLFDKYFDEVHQDFLVRLKDLHPVLTPNDLRLCSYLKMNLSTKEIAPLMNISVRGLEISRYRLRRKLEIPRETNLTEYILNI